MAHTPAPWTSRRAAYGGLWVGPALLPHPGKESSNLAEQLAQRQDDAALIAAAPDMLTALKTIALHAPSLDVQGIRELADAAIAAAEGTQA